MADGELFPASKVEIFPTTLGGAEWAWMLWRRAAVSPPAWVMLACETGFASHREAKANYYAFVEAAAQAPLTVRKKERPCESPKRM